MSGPIAQIRALRAEIFAPGMTRLSEQSLWKMRELLEGNGFNRSVALLDELAMQKDASGRFKCFTKLILAIRQLEVARLQYPRLKAGGFMPVPSLRGFAIPPAYGEMADPAQVRQFLETKRYRVPGCYLVSEKLDPARLTLHELVPLLSHSFYRTAALEKLCKLPEDRRETLGNRLVTLKNALLRRAGVTLLGSLGARVSTTRVLATLLADPTVGREVREVFQSLGPKSASALGTVLESGDDNLREQAARLLRSLADERSEPILKRMLNDPSPPVRAWAKLGLYAIGTMDPKFLQSGAESRDDPLLRIYCKVELVKAGALPPAKLMAEATAEGAWRQHKILGPALSEVPQAEELLRPTVDTFMTGQTREQRRLAFELLQHVSDTRFRWLFHAAAGDCDPDLARKALEIVVRAEGFFALEKFVDLRPVLTRPYTKLTQDERDYAINNVFPFVARTGDCRFVPYLAGLIRERCFSGITIEYTYSLRPALTEFGAPLAGALKDLSTDEIPNIAGAAREVLAEIGAKLQ